MLTSGMIALKGGLDRAGTINAGHHTFFFPHLSSGDPAEVLVLTRQVLSSELSPSPDLSFSEDQQDHSDITYFSLMLSARPCSTNTVTDAACLAEGHRSTHVSVISLCDVMLSLAKPILPS